jgi:UDP-N-acetylglucosamine--N-acetylmuramyl-(pentapeptide) pyrophosphoryl-undecaprenol N-acetylglucosamine transferase
VTKAALTFEEAVPFFGKKGIVTGNPVRKEFFEIPPKTRDADKFSLLIFGGSQGARAINNAMVEALPELQNYRSKLRITHQTGEADFEKIKQGYAGAGWNEAEVSAYIKNMPEHFEKNDLIICRAGATSCAELAAAGKASVMIPLPTAADDHQRKNAEALERAGAARMILQKDLTGAGLAKQIIEFIESPAKITEMEAAAKKLARQDAAEVTVDIIEDLAKER